MTENWYSRSFSFVHLLSRSQVTQTTEMTCSICLLFQIMDGFLEDYNVSSKAPMDLVLFRFAIEHVSRICRVLRQPNGHALIVGM